MSCVAHISSKNRACLFRNLSGNAQRCPIECFQLVFPSYETQFRSIRIIGKCLNDVRACAYKLSVQLSDGFWMRKRHLRYKWPELDIPSFFQLEEIAFGTNDGLSGSQHSKEAIRLRDGRETSRSCLNLADWMVGWQ